MTQGKAPATAGFVLLLPGQECCSWGHNGVIAPTDISYQPMPAAPTDISYQPMPAACYGLAAYS